MLEQSYMSRTSPVPKVKQPGGQAVPAGPYTRASGHTLSHFQGNMDIRLHSMGAK